MRLPVLGLLLQGQGSLSQAQKPTTLRWLHPAGPKGYGEPSPTPLVFNGKAIELAASLPRRSVIHQVHQVHQKSWMQDPLSAIHIQISLQQSSAHGPQGLRDRPVPFQAVSMYLPSAVIKLAFILDFPAFGLSSYTFFAFLMTNACKAETRGRGQKSLGGNQVTSLLWRLTYLSGLEERDSL